VAGRGHGSLVYLEKKKINKYSLIFSLFGPYLLNFFALLVKKFGPFLLLMWRNKPFRAYL